MKRRTFIATSLAAGSFGGFTGSFGLGSSAFASDIPNGTVNPDRLADLLVDAVDPLIVTAKSNYLRDGVARHYALRNYAGFWFGADTPAGKAADLKAALANADREGLNPADYDPTLLPGWNKSPEHAELAYSFAAARYGIDVQNGRADPKRIEPDLFVYSRETKPDSVLLRLGLATNVQDALDKMAPQSERYQRLRLAYAAWRARAQDPVPALVPDGPTLKPGMQDDRLPVIRDRLRYAGDTTLVASGTDYDSETQSAVMRFQAQHGLAPDGAVGKKSIATLNRNAADRAKTIALNMERLRWMPDDLGPKYVIVNIADFRLNYVISRKVILDMAVVVGRPYRRTPVFSDKIRYLDFSPTWTVPPTVLVKDIIPKLKKDPSAIDRLGFEFFTSGDAGVMVDPATIDWATVTPKSFPYQIRQRSGDENALGRVKFMFPNAHNIYLHDSPHRELYAFTERAFSSGCIRLSQPEALAKALLAQMPDWSETRIEEAMDQPKPIRVVLPEPVPVHITYMTAWVDDHGDVQFRPDIYERDKVLAAALPA
ncbi:MAG: L,D-transpeptidase family protein [Alphaproteobacteria bacterium]|nr:L,D-transpeptidase family protein [Alphaproteobacteria bacterium]